MNTDGKVTRFSVHKNTADKRKRHAASEHLRNAARVMASEKQVRGYAIVTWDKDGESIRTASFSQISLITVSPAAVQSRTRH